MIRSLNGKPHAAHAASLVASAALLALFSAAGCNSLTGADGLEIATHGGNAAGGGGGAAAGGDGGAAATTTTTAAAMCAYPSTGFSNKPGGVQQDHTWQGFVNESMDVADVKMDDYLDCDGSKGVNALLIDVSATWCGSCQEEAKTLTNKMKTQWDALGIRVLTLMIEDAASKPATPDTALAWKKQYGLTSTTVAADPGFTFQSLATGGSVGLPFMIVVDPRTMTLVETQQGFPLDENKIVALAKKNQAAQ